MPKASFVHLIDGAITQNGKFHSRFFGKARKVQRPGEFADLSTYTSLML